MVYICGLDESGRGPVIGFLVIAGALIKENEINKLRELGVKDSKLLSPLQRESIAKELRKIVKYKLIKLSPREIDGAVEGQNSNLNWLEADNTIKILNELKPNKAYIDCPSNNIEAYKNYLQKKLKSDIELHVGHKMDFIAEICSAASILAKVERDKEIENIKKKIKIDFGSGYPSDPKTQEFLKKHYKDFPDIIRKSWASYKNLIENKKQRKIGEY
ncbi:ribonuclease HII [Candidatus Woesearchaeota archaeon]|nr:ribonuclease HII [Candidatus Woesearchaeota archaeon]